VPNFLSTYASSFDYTTCYIQARIKNIIVSCIIAYIEYDNIATF